MAASRMAAAFEVEAARCCWLSHCCCTEVCVIVFRELARQLDNLESFSGHSRSASLQASYLKRTALGSRSLQTALNAETGSIMPLPCKPGPCPPYCLPLQPLPLPPTRGLPELLPSFSKAQHKASEWKARIPTCTGCQAPSGWGYRRPEEEFSP